MDAITIRLTSFAKEANELANALDGDASYEAGYLADEAEAIVQLLADGQASAGAAKQWLSEARAKLDDL